MEKAVLCGKLWFRECRSENQDLPKELPVSFQSAEQYVEAYEALIFEEARESMLHSKMDNHAFQTQAILSRYIPAMLTGNISDLKM